MEKLTNPRFVKIHKAAELTGYSINAIRTKINKGIWPENAVWKWAPDGVQLIDMKGYEAWAGSLGVASRRGHRKFR